MAMLLEEIKKDPAKYFSHPQEVLKDDRLSFIDKEIILLNWIDQLDQLSCASSEGMCEDIYAIDLMPRVKNALIHLRALHAQAAV